MNYFFSVLLDNYANFRGRARRKEYWMYTLIYFLITTILYALFLFNDTQTMAAGQAKLPFWGGLLFFFSLLTLLPTMAVTARRLHDVGKSGWFQLLNLIPFANLYLLYLLIQDGDISVNKWGPNPKDPLGSEYVSNGPMTVTQDESW